MRPLSRRTFLRGASGVALALPFLDAMRPSRARAQPAPSPRRIMFVFQANGDQTAKRFSAAGETSFELGEFLAPLEPYREDLVFINKLHKRFYNLPEDERADNHQQGGSSLAPWKSGTGSFPIGGAETTIGYVEGPSADYVIGGRVLEAEEGVAHRHLVFRIGQKYNNIWNTHAHAGPVGEQNPIPPETDPYEAYARIFSFASDGAAQQEVLRRLAKRQSAIDLVREEGNTLLTKLGAEDRAKVQQHLEAIRDVERALQAPSDAAACAPTPLGERLDPYKDENHVIMGELFFKISALAFACDLTRVVNFNWSGNTSNRVYSNLGLSEGHHDISHNSDDAAFADIRKIHKHLWQQNTKLYEILKSTSDGDGTLWDHTLVVHWNELGQGDTHSINDSLVVFAGKAHDHFRRGRLLDFDNKRSFADMLVSCFHYMGFEDVTSFGEDALNTGGALPLT
ncbi:hypothetical protein SOCEGT47_078340 [Sorangium cellulosum]|uniref:DUF1552 domain-containing protein n=1 Tax=Sorangium cellulosum TaxID=56 RepID=A0A4P2QBZ7_SORCE|nr:DUF1552 domain-containing protein [Sorangium cellulosum]AUX27250.1 hypothetical protein SOCEGT47_078340 [Sorangium cellulosum]